MTSPFTLHALPQLATVTLRGADARPFLQGQLSHDLNLLTTERALLASCNSAQGRVQCILTLISRGDEIIAVVPASMVALLIKRLKFYVLRAKVTLEDSSQTLLVADVAADATHTDLPSQPGETRQLGSVTLMRWWSTEPRWLALHAPTDISQHRDNTHADTWQQRDIAAGLPQVYPETHEHFVAQMLNLDALNGISFNKGCYTGQEIIARTHFRGTVKRRMSRFTCSGQAPQPGTRIVNGDQPAGEVVNAVNTATGCELLAVISLDQLPTHRGGVLTLECIDPVSAQTSAPLASLPLPYALPD